MTETALLKGIAQKLDRLAAGDSALSVAAVGKLRADIAELPRSAEPPVRIIHHFACTGGTLISKFIAATPNTRVLSEVDPLSTLTPTAFAPLDLARQYKNSGVAPPPKDLEELFVAGLKVLHAKMTSRGERLVLRDHSHSHFCVGPNVPKRPTLGDIVARVFPCVSVLSVRHPLDSFLSMQTSKFVHFSPDTLEEYAARYMQFLDAYDGVAVVKYEDFVTDHDATFQRICGILDLVHHPGLSAVLPALKMTGDSGRSGADLALRPRREIPSDTDAMRKSCQSYVDLCARLDYAP